MKKPTAFAKRQGELNSGELTTAGEGAGQKMYFYFRSDPLNDKEKLALEGTKETIRSGLRSCKDNDVRLVLVFVPTKWRVYRDLVRLPAETRLTPGRENDLPEQLKSWCSTAEVPFLDLTPPLTRAAQGDGPLIYFLDDEHWTGQGCEVVANEITAFLKRMEWPVKPPTSGR